MGTELDDAFVIARNGIFGAGLNVQVSNTEESYELDGLEGNDQFFLLSTAFDAVTTIIGGKGSDTFNVAGDVTAPIFSQDSEGLSGVINHGVSSSDPYYDGLPAEGVAVQIADAESIGQVVIKETDGRTIVQEHNGGTVDHYSIALAAAPSAPVYVTVSATSSNSEEALQGGQTMLISSGGALDEALTLTFDASNWDVAWQITVKASDDNLSEGPRTVTVNHSVLSADTTFNLSLIHI